MDSRYRVEGAAAFRAMSAQELRAGQGFGATTYTRRLLDAQWLQSWLVPAMVKPGIQTTQRPAPETTERPSRPRTAPASAPERAPEPSDDGEE